jgi:hypothetical protein
MVAVNVESGERRAFDRLSGVELVDTVMATGVAGSAQATTLISQPAATKLSFLHYANRGRPYVWLRLMKA